MPGESHQTAPQDPLGSIFVRFLKFGFLAWGGPAAQIAMIKRECVDEEHWISEESFRKLLAVYQVLPGPEAHELCVYFGRLRGGKLGGFLAGLGFMLPGFVLMLGLSVLYVEANLAGNLEEIFYGLTAAVGALVARALLRLGRSFITDVPLAILAAAGFGLTLGTSASFVLVLLGAGIAYELWTNGRRWMRHAHSVSFAPWALVVLIGAVTLSLTAEIFFEGLKAGLLTFGGAYTVIPFLREASVAGHHWLTNSQFVDGLALSGILPAPLIIFSTFVGYLAGGLAGGLAMTVGIFIPAFVFPIFLHRHLVAVAENERLRPFLLGVAAGVVGLIAAVTVPWSAIEEAGGFWFGLPPTEASLDAYLQMLDGCPLPWSVAVLGDDLFATELPALALERGGHLRVGLEDHKGRTVTNAELVAEAVNLAEKAGRPVASSIQTAELLGL